MKVIWLRTALLNFLLAAIIGVILRYAFVDEVHWLKYKNFQFAHSHVAMLGWVYMALYSLFIAAFLRPEQQEAKVYQRLFWLSQVSVAGMLVSFPIQGYGPVSITFSTLHIIAAYLFVRRFWGDTRVGSDFSHRMARTALLWMVFSTLGVWVLGPIMVTSLRRSELYYMAVQFFLHFQFNGWFIFGVLALFFRWLESKGIQLHAKQQSQFYWLLVVATFLTFALAVAWSEPHPPVFAANSIGVLIQLAALWVLRAQVTPVLPQVKANMETWAFRVWQISLLAYILKVLIQASVAIPAVATMAYTIRNFVIGFVHLMMLGVISTFLFTYFDQCIDGWHRTRLTRAGVAVFVTGILLSELLLFVQGTSFWIRLGFIPFYHEALFGVSLLLPLGIGLTLLGQMGRTVEL